MIHPPNPILIIKAYISLSTKVDRRIAERVQGSLQFLDGESYTGGLGRAGFARTLPPGI